MIDRLARFSVPAASRMESGDALPMPPAAGRATFSATVPASLPPAIGPAVTFRRTFVRLREPVRRPTAACRLASDRDRVR
ncbi:MAG: hypothetical protein EBZ59_02405 [Planctomycetia bacterium]|nr:hypothetical protein [Planctomycetia bacterium]